MKPQSISKMCLPALSRESGKIWGKLCKLRPALIGYTVPIVRVDGRMTAALGYSYGRARIVRLSGVVIEDNYRLFVRHILPHELIHQADMDLYGEPINNDWHRASWVKLMLEYGIKPKLEYRIK